jgi:flavin-dependent dehydrogenase
VASAASYQAVRAAFIKLAKDQDVQLLNPRRLEILQLDESGVDVALGKTMLRATMLIVGGTLPQSQQKLLGLPESWGPDVLHRYSFFCLKTAKWAVDPGSRPVAAMSLDLAGKLSWAWFLPHGPQVQLAVEQPLETASNGSGEALLRHWGEVLGKHGVLKGAGALPAANAATLDLPFAGALAHEGVANRTLLIGPAGGFFSACGEDLYPNCWSAVYAADAAKKALKERYLQDALQPYRQKWRTTLGNYLRGPQQNLRFLLPLVYRNPVMTTRLAESILLGKSVVR